MSNNECPQDLHPESAARAARIEARRYSDSLLLVVVLFAGTTAAFWFRPVSVLSNGEPDVTVTARLSIGIDPNTAGWHELALLPRIGETLARRISDYRAEKQARFGSIPPVYQSPADLSKVRGIGDKTIQRITPFLRFGGKAREN